MVLLDDDRDRHRLGPSVVVGARTRGALDLELVHVLWHAFHGHLATRLVYGEEALGLGGGLPGYDEAPHVV